MKTIIITLGHSLIGGRRLQTTHLLEGPNNQVHRRADLDYDGAPDTDLVPVKDQKSTSTMTIALGDVVYLKKHENTKKSRCHQTAVLIKVHVNTLARRGYQS